MYKNRYNESKVIGLYTQGLTRSFYLREIAGLAKLPLKTAQDILKSLEKDNILTSKVRGKNKYFRLNLDNLLTKFFLLQAEINKTQVFLKGHPTIKTFLKETKNNSCVIIFGSFAKGTERKDSDLDILIVGKQELSFHLLPHKVHNVELTETSFRTALKQGEALLQEIEENHIILNNHSFYVNEIWNHYAKR